MGKEGFNMGGNLRCVIKLDLLEDNFSSYLLTLPNCEKNEIVLAFVFLVGMKKGGQCSNETEPPIQNVNLIC